MHNEQLDYQGSRSKEGLWWEFTAEERAEKQSPKIKSIPGTAGASTASHVQIESKAADRLLKDQKRNSHY